MSTARHIRMARRSTGWPLGHQDPDEDDDEDEPVECADAYEIEPDLIEPTQADADAAEDRWTAWRDSTASQ